MTGKRKHAKLEGVSDRERFYVAAVKSSQHAFLTTGPDGNITAWSPGAERLFGYTAEEAVGQTMSLIVPADRQHERVANGNKLRRLEHISKFKTVRQHKSGRPIDVMFDASPILSDDRRLLGFSYIARDITEEKLAHDMFHFAFDASPNGMILTDADGKILMISAETEHLFGFARDQVEGQSIDMLIPPEPDRHVYRDGNGRDGGTRVQSVSVSEALGRRSDGSRFPIEFRSSSIVTGNGTLTLSSVTDISERRRIVQLKDEFVSNVSHELRTPLTSIAGSLTLIAGGAAGQLPEQALRLITIAHKNSERLIRLINDLLDIEKMESGKLHLEFKPCNAIELIEQAIEANRGFAAQFSVGFEFHPPQGPMLIRADADRFVQVVTNLLSNAAKFSPAGQDVEISIARCDGAVRIDVRDHGPGIPEEFGSRLFEKFAQADDGHKGGTGLGLSIVRQLVVLHGGRIWVESPPDGGTTFRMEFMPWCDIAVDGTDNDAPGGHHGQTDRGRMARQDNREVA